MDTEVKQVIVVRKDLKMGAGKLSAQVAHASVSSYIESVKKDEKVAKAWINSGQKKIVLAVEDEESVGCFFCIFKPYFRSVLCIRPSCSLHSRFHILNFFFCFFVVFIAPGSKSKNSSTTFTVLER